MKEQSLHQSPQELSSLPLDGQSWWDQPRCQEAKAKGSLTERCVGNQKTFGGKYSIGSMFWEPEGGLQGMNLLAAMSLAKLRNRTTG